MAEEFSKVATKVSVTVGISGTGGGFKRFCAGETAISAASRPISSSEVELAAKNKIEFIEVPVAYDALSIVVHPKNDWVKTITLAQVKAIFNAGGAKTWKEIDPTWPDRPMKLFSPGTDSGTFDYFKEAVLGKDGKMRSDISVSEEEDGFERLAAWAFRWEKGWEWRKGKSIEKSLDARGGIGAEVLAKAKTN